MARRYVSPASWQLADAWDRLPEHTRAQILSQIRVGLGDTTGGLVNRRDTRAKVVEQLAEDYPPDAMAWVHHTDWSGPTRVPLDHIDPEMPWMTAADPAHVQDFVTELQKGNQLKPVILVKSPSAPKLVLSDGHHRYLAACEMGQPVRSWIGTVTTKTGPWQSMHRYQKNVASAGGRAPSAGGARAAAGRGRDASLPRVSVLNRADPERERAADQAFAALAATIEATERGA